MFAFIETSDKKRVGLFKRFCGLFRRDYGVDFSLEHFCNMPYLRVKIENSPKENHTGEIPHSVRKEIVFLADVLRQHNIREVCFHNNFPYKEAVLDERFFEVGIGSLNEAVAHEVAAQFIGDGEKTAVVFASKVSQVCRDTIYEISSKFRFLLLCMEEHEQGICKELQEIYGVSTIFNPAKKRVLDADLALFFDYPSEKIDLSPNCTIFSVKPLSLIHI